MNSAEAASQPQMLFECKDSDWSVRLIGTTEGKLLLVTSKLSGPPSTANVASNWEDIREGYVIGQQGGHQGHVRLFDGIRHIVLFEAMQGELSDQPGKMYAGVFTRTPSNPDQDFRVACVADDTNANLLAGVRSFAEGAGHEWPQPEIDGSEFDGWF